MPSPTTPKQCVAPQAIRVSTMMSAVVRSGPNSGAGWTQSELKIPTPPKGSKRGLGGGRAGARGYDACTGHLKEVASAEV